MQFQKTARYPVGASSNMPNNNPWYKKHNQFLGVKQEIDTVIISR
jgi:hypothetical protein